MNFRTLGSRLLGGGLKLGGFVRHLERKAVHESKQVDLPHEYFAVPRFPCQRSGEPYMGFGCWRRR